MVGYGSGMHPDHASTLNQRRDAAALLEDLRPAVTAAIVSELNAGTPYEAISEESGLGVEAIRRIARKAGARDPRVTPRTAAAGRYLEEAPDLKSNGIGEVLAAVGRELVGASPPAGKPDSVLAWIHANTEPPPGHYLGESVEPDEFGRFPWGIWPDPV